MSTNKLPRRGVGRRTADRSSRKKANGAPIIRLGQEDWSYYFANHNQRLDSIDNMAKTLQQDIRDLRTGQAQDTQYLNQRIDVIQKDLTDKMENQTATLTEHFDSGIKSVKELHNDNNARLGRLENWRTLIAGGAIVLFFIIGDVLVRAFAGPLAEVVLKFFAN